jgi:hypothetical protein
MLIEDGNKETCFSFCNPKQCPSKKPRMCINYQAEGSATSLEADVEIPQNQGMPLEDKSDLHHRRKMIKAPLVCTRSEGVIG